MYSNNIRKETYNRLITTYIKKLDLWSKYTWLYTIDINFFFGVKEFFAIRINICFESVK